MILHRRRGFSFRNDPHPLGHWLTTGVGDAHRLYFRPLFLFLESEAKNRIRWMEPIISNRGNATFERWDMPGEVIGFCYRLNKRGNLPKLLVLLPPSYILHPPDATTLSCLEAPLVRIICSTDPLYFSIWNAWWLRNNL